MRYEVYLSKDGAERRIELDLDVQFKPNDEFRYGPHIYVVTSVQPGNDEFDAILFADLACLRQRRRAYSVEREAPESGWRESASC